MKKPHSNQIYTAICRLVKEEKVRIVSILGRREGCVIYLYEFADALEIGDYSTEGKRQRTYCQVLTLYFHLQFQFDASP